MNSIQKAIVRLKTKLICQMFLKDMNKNINHDNEEVIYNFGESEPEEVNNKDEAGEKNLSSHRRHRSSKFWECIEIEELEDKFVNKQLTNTTSDFNNGNSDNKPMAAVRRSLRSQTQTSEKSKQTEVELFANKQLTKNAQTEEVSDMNIVLKKVNNFLNVIL